MPEFYLKDPNYDPPTIDFLHRNWWSTIPDPQVARLVASEHQYLHFHMHLLKNLSFRTATRTGDLDLSLRAGAIKAGQLMCASILEAVLRAHAERRGYRRLLNQDPEKRTFGKVVEMWSKRKWPDLDHVSQDVVWFKNLRDNVHLFRTKSDRRTMHTLLREEEELKTRGRRAVDAVSRLVSP